MAVSNLLNTVSILSFGELTQNVKCEIFCLPTINVQESTLVSIACKPARLETKPQRHHSSRHRKLTHEKIIFKSVSHELGIIQTEQKKKKQRN